MSAGTESVFPRIAPDDPLARAARWTNQLAEDVGLEATLERMGMTTGAAEIAYLGEQRALRAMAAFASGVNMGEAPAFDEALAQALVRSPLWQEYRLLLVGLFMDGVAIGWKGRELAGGEVLEAAHERGWEDGYSAAISDARRSGSRAHAELAGSFEEPPRDAIRRIVDYDWQAEQRDYEEQVRAGEIEEDDPRHVFTDLRQVAEWLQAGDA